VLESDLSFRKDAAKFRLRLVCHFCFRFNLRTSYWRRFNSQRCSSTSCTTTSHWKPDHLWLVPEARQHREFIRFVWVL